MQLFNTGVHLSLPPAHLFKLPPNPEPAALPPPPVTDEWTLKSPLAINPETYNTALQPNVPITFALVYFTIVTLWNQINRKRGWRPWAISRTRPFKDFTLIHNVLLAIYSAFTFAGMCRAMWVSTPGWFGDAPVVHQIDALCKMQGPRGFGDAVSYDPAGLKWAVKNKAINLGVGGLAPDPTDVGRIWNEGLAFWGWLFYLSKFYEVVDTMIALLKGKRATTLQTFHHFGAMFAMWAGMRYMSVPIWMFVIINSFIHTLMYTFYACSVVGIKVNPRIKRVITTLQISQFILGIFYASIHLFISYDVPVSTPYTAISVLSNSTTAQNAASDFWSSAVEAGRSSGVLPAWAKRIMYRAVGAEGLAESVRDGHIYTDRQAHLGQTSPNRSSSPFESPAGTNHRQSTHSERVRCIDTQGQTFAIWLNVVYLMPLMGLFVRFFVKSYLRGSQQSRGKNAGDEQRRFSDSVGYAGRKTSEIVESLGTQAEEAVDDAAEQTEQSAEAAGEKAREAKQSIKNTDPNKVAEDLKNSDTVTKAKKKATDAKESVKDTDLNKMGKDVKNSDAAKKASEKAAQAKESIKETDFNKIAEDVKNSNAANKASETSEEVFKALKEKSQKLKQMAKDSNLGDSYVEVIEKMRKGAMQASGVEDSSGAEDGQDGSKDGGLGRQNDQGETKSKDQPEEEDTSNASATDDTTASTAASSTDELPHDEIHEQRDNSNILAKKNSEPDLKVVQNVKAKSPKKSKK